MGLLKTWMVQTREFLSKDEVSARLARLERSLNRQHVDRHQAQVTKDQGVALADLIRSLDGIEEAAILVGSLLIAKTTGSNGKTRIFSRTLSQDEVLLLEENPDLLRSPGTILARLGAEPLEPGGKKN